jgi:hypothetical protein
LSLGNSIFNFAHQLKLVIKELNESSSLPIELIDDLNDITVFKTGFQQAFDCYTLCPSQSASSAFWLEPTDAHHPKAKDNLHTICAETFEFREHHPDQLGR